jgi:hypothetical protein
LKKAFLNYLLKQKSFGTGRLKDGLDELLTTFSVQEYQEIHGILVPFKEGILWKKRYPF